jgi:hypothetical protein
MIGDNGTLANSLMTGTGFTKELIVPYDGVQLVVYKSMQPGSLVDGDVNVTSTSSPNPDQINVNIVPPTTTTAIIVKEAYFPTWRATANGAPLVVEVDKTTGYILLILPAGTETVTLYQYADQAIWSLISSISLVTLIVLTALIYLRGRKTRQPQPHSSREVTHH